MTDNELREEIVRLMLAKRWYGHSVDDLAEKHKLTHRHVNKVFLEASRAISIYGDVKGQVAAKIAELDGVIRKAMERQGFTMGGDPYDNPDLKAAIAAIRVQLEAWGAIGPRRKLVAGDGATEGVTADEYAKMEPKDRIQAHLAAIEEEKAKMEGGDRGGMH